MKKLVFLLSWLPFCVGAQQFAPVATYSLGGPAENPRGLATADVNRDGYLDVLTANYASSSVRVLLNQRDGTFAPGSRYSLGSNNNPYDIAVGDFNQDSYPDLVTANYLGGTVGVLLNRQDGTFAAPTTYPLGSAQYPQAVGIADLNQDGYPDVIAATLGTNTVAVLLNQRDGTLRLVASYPLPAASLNVSLALGDWNQDGYADVAVASFTNTTSAVTLWRTQADGSLASVGAYNLGGGRQPYGLALGDVTRDGLPDLVAGDLAGNAVLVLRNQLPAGTFTLSSAYATGAGSQPYGVALQDVDGDRFADIVTANIGTSTAGMLLSRAMGDFVLTTAYSTGLGSEPSRLVVADVNRDNRPDIVVANSGSGSIGVLLGTAALATMPSSGPTTTVTISPNPATGPVQLAITGLPREVSRVEINLVDLAGRVVLQTKLTVTRGPLTEPLPISSLATGVYLVEIKGLSNQGQIVCALATKRLAVL